MSQTADPLQTLAALGRRFHGVDLAFRRSGTDWPMPWRARLVSNKNEREDFRLQSFGATAHEAVAALAQLVEAA